MDIVFRESGQGSLIPVGDHELTYKKLTLSLLPCYPLPLLTGISSCLSVFDVLLHSYIVLNVLFDVLICFGACSACWIASLIVVCVAVVESVDGICRNDPISDWSAFLGLIFFFRGRMFSFSTVNTGGSPGDYLVWNCLLYTIRENDIGKKDRWRTSQHNQSTSIHKYSIQSWQKYTRTYLSTMQLMGIKRYLRRKALVFKQLFLEYFSG